MPFQPFRRMIADQPGAHEPSAEAASQRNAELTKPPGALGRLEDLAIWAAAWQGRASPRAERIQALVFAGNHGITAQGISAFPAEVTVQMVANFEGGGAAINQLCRVAGATLGVHALELERVQVGGGVRDRRLDLAEDRLVPVGLTELDVESSLFEVLPGLADPLQRGLDVRALLEEALGALLIVPEVLGGHQVRELAQPCLFAQEVKDAP